MQAIDSGSVVFVDDAIVVFNKPAGMPAHPLKEGEGGTALDSVVAQYPEVATASDDPREGGLCHRLDNDTSGLLLFARDKSTHVKMRAAFSTGEIHRFYLALVSGHMGGECVLDAPIAHHQKNARKMVAVGENGMRYFRGKPQSAKTHVKSLDANTKASLVEAKLEGGRRHQIRVHMASAGHPLIGDTLYGGPEAIHLPGQALHAFALQILGYPIFRAGPPEAFELECQEHALRLVKRP